MWSFFAFLLILTPIAAVHIDCEFANLQINHEKIFSCTIEGQFEILRQNSIITSSSEPSSDSKKSISNVHGLAIDNKKVFFFPKGIEKIFSNLNFIRVIKSGLKEIHQSDLEPFLDLKHLILENNELKAIESDLFKFNSKLQTILFSQNKIDEIDSKVFDNLNELKNLNLRGLKCIAENSIKKDVKSVIESVKKGCSKLSETEENSSSENKNLKDEISKIKIESENLKSDNQKLQNALKNSNNNLNQAKFEVLKLNSLTKNLTSENEKLMLKISQLSDVIEKLKTENLNFHTDKEKVLNSLKSDVENLGSQLNYFQNKALKMDAKKTQIETKNVQLKAESEKCKNEQAILELEILQLKEENEKFEGGSQKFEAESLKIEEPQVFNQKSLHESQLESKVEKCQTEHSILLAEILTLNTTVENLKVEAENCSNFDNFEALNSQIENLKSELSLKDSEITTKKIKLNLIKLQLANSSSNLTQTTDKINLLTQQLYEINRELSQKNSDIHKCEDEVRKLSASESLLKFHQTSKVDECEEKLSKVESKLEESAKSQVDEISKSNLKISQLEENLAKKCDKKILEIQSNSIKIEENLNACKIDLESSKQQQQKLQNDLKTLKDQEEFENQENKQEFKFIDDQQITIDFLNLKIEKLTSNLTKSQQNFKILTNELQKCLEDSITDDDFISELIKDSPHDKFLIAFWIIVALAVVNLIMMTFCCFRSRKYEKSMRISNVDDYRDDFEFSKVHVKLVDAGNIYQSIKQVKGGDESV